LSRSAFVLAKESRGAAAPLFHACAASRARRFDAAMLSRAIGWPALTAATHASVLATDAKREWNTTL